MLNKLYGDGIHDDTAAIQEMIDTAGCELSLPAPEKFYIISKPLELPSFFKLILPRSAEIRLSKGANCVMLKNKLEIPTGSEYTGSYASYVKAYADATPSRDIEVCGGIWNANNMEQAENPLFVSSVSIAGFWGFCFSFYKTSNLRLSKITIKDPTAHGIALDFVSYFTIEEIVFDYNNGNPKPISMDGIHIMGNCSHGVIHDLTGACRESAVEMNSDQGSCGDIAYISIDDVKCGLAPCGIRAFTCDHNVEHLHISNVSGTFFQTCLAFINSRGRLGDGAFDGITIENVHAELTKTRPEMAAHPDYPEGPFVYIDYHVHVKNITISDFYHEEKTIPRETFLIGECTKIDRMIMTNVHTSNSTDGKCPLFLNYGYIDYLVYRNVDTGKDDRYPLRISFGKIMEFNAKEN